MDDRTSLLNELRIDRDETAEPRQRYWFAWVGATAVVAGGVVATWLMLTLPEAEPEPVVVAVAEPIETGVPVPRGSTLDSSGYVVARRQATVSSKITGRVVEVRIEEGQRVEGGDVVARLDDANARAQLAVAVAQLGQAEAQWNAARVAFDNAGSTFARNDELFAQQVISAQAFDVVKAEYDADRIGLEVAEQGVDVARANVALARRNFEDTVVRAPFDGVVTVKAAQEGEMVSPVSAGGGFTRTGIGTIVDMDSLEVEVDVSESFINRVYPGQDVVVRLNAYPERPIPAGVIAVIPTADRAKATVRVRIGLLEKDERILPEMGVRVSFLDERSDAKPYQE